MKHINKGKKIDDFYGESDWELLKPWFKLRNYLLNKKLDEIQPKSNCVGRAGSKILKLLK